MAYQYAATKTKNVHEFQLNLDKIIEMENEDPEFTLMKLIDSLDGNIRFSTIEKLCSLLGWTYRDLLAEGYTYVDLANILVGCVEELGFTSEPPEQNS